MNNRSLIRVLAALAMLGSVVGGLGGCASLSKSECMNANWEDIGIRDGANGQPEEYLIQHSTACAKVNVVPDRGAWLHGREQGLERFCLPSRAYQLGEYGSGFDVGICRNFDQDRLQDAYGKGRDVHRLADELGSIDNEIRDINVRLEDKDKDKPLAKKDRDALMFRLGVLTVQRIDAQRAYEDARYRARDL
ncbi:MAG TPA: DUF2799 domain-containing protein [Steroidobacteraceae bacterium]|jgi:hypothetical protein|nr:DUF2799 domain-containing protein [Steroidobacteraceae bacterium]